jgi:hypothetical protein
MTKHLLTSIGILILVLSCKQTETKKAEIPEQKETVELKAEQEKPIEEIPKLEQYFENDSLLILLESDLDKLTLNPKFDLKTKPKSNAHDQTITDTIKTLTFDKTKIYSYRATDWESIYEAKIENSDFKFLDSIRVGTKKVTFENLLKREFKMDLIKIGNLEQTSVFIFNFENGLLRAINYEGYLD